MIEGYCGRVGSGKTYCMVKRALKEKAKGKDIYANMELDWATQFDRWEDLIGLRNGIVLLDEAGIWFASRNYRDCPSTVMSYLAQSRKQGIHLWYTVQHELGVDAVLRRLTSTIYHHERFGPFIVQSVVDPASGQKFGRRFHRLRADIYSKYDTYEIVGDSTGQGHGRGAAGERKRQRAEKAYKGGLWVRDALMGLIRYRHAEPNDLLEGREILGRNGGRWEPVEVK